MQKAREETNTQLHSKSALVNKKLPAQIKTVSSRRRRMRQNHKTNSPVPGENGDNNINPTINLTLRLHHAH
jgi:hypothetical protein